MDAAAVINVTTAMDNIDNGEPDALSDDICLNDIESLSSHGARMQEPGNAGELLTRVELDVAYCSEKLLNLEILLMQVSTSETECELLAVDNSDISEESAEKGLEFDLLSGILDSELKELNNFMLSLQTEIVYAHQKNSSRERIEESFIEIDEKLLDSEETLKQSQNQLGEMKIQVSNFQRTLSLFSGEENCNNKDVGSSENGQFSHMDTKLKMQTVEQQKHILRMLEKSLARELDMEKKLCDSRNSEEELRKKLHSAEQDLFWMEEETKFVYGRVFEAENAAELLIGISKGLMGRLQVLQFSLNGSIQREAAMESKLQDSMEQIRTKESSLQKLEKELRESNIQLQHAKAAAEATEEQQNMLYAEIDDRETLIDDLKSKVSKAESRAEKAEAKCALLSETNLEINDELNIIRNRMECLEISLNQADDEKIATAKDISIRTTAIADLVLRLSMERERLQKQISSLVKENKILASKKGKDLIDTIKPDPVDDPNTCTKASEEAVAESTSTFQVDKLSKDTRVVEREVRAAGSREDVIGGVTAVETVRSIDACQLNSKYYLVPILILLISMLVVYLLQLEKCPF